MVIETESRRRVGIHERRDRQAEDERENRVKGGTGESKEQIRQDDGT